MCVYTYYRRLYKQRGGKTFIFCYLYFEFLFACYFVVETKLTLLFVLCLVSVLTCKFEVDIGIDSFQVEEKHPSVISLDAFESAQKEWKKMKEKAEKTDPRTDESRGCESVQAAGTWRLSTSVR